MDIVAHPKVALATAGNSTGPAILGSLARDASQFVVDHPPMHAHRIQVASLHIDGTVVITGLDTQIGDRPPSTVAECLARRIGRTDRATRVAGANRIGPINEYILAGITYDSDGSRAVAAALLAVARQRTTRLVEYLQGIVAKAHVLVLA